VESLYFDILQFLYQLSLAVLVGGAIVVGAPSRRYDRIAGLALLVLVVSSILKLLAFEDISVGPRLIARWIALGVLAAAALYAGAYAAPVARTYREQTRDFDSLPASAPARRELAKLEASAARALRVVILAGLVALFLS
jgi:type VI protein secretion system component VasK